MPGNSKSSYQFSGVRHGLVGVAEGVKDELAVAVHGDVDDHVSSGALSGDQVAHSSALRFGEGAGAGEGFGAHVAVVVD